MVPNYILWNDTILFVHVSPNQKHKYGSFLQYPAQRPLQWYYTLALFLQYCLFHLPAAHQRHLPLQCASSLSRGIYTHHKYYILKY